MYGVYTPEALFDPDPWPYLVVAGTWEEVCAYVRANDPHRQHTLISYAPWTIPALVRAWTWN